MIFLFPVALITIFFSEPGWLSYTARGATLYFALGGTCLAREVRGVADALASGGIQAGREKIAMLVSRDTGKMSESDVVSSAVETLAENFSDSAVATLIYAAAGGPVLAWFHRVSNTLDAMVGYRTEKYAEFGWASAKLDDVMNFIPARITSVIVALASPLAGGNLTAAMSRVSSDGRSLSSPNSGYPIAAFAGALGIRLCGPTYYFGKRYDKPFIGAGGRPGTADLTRALRLYWAAYGAAALSFVAIGGLSYL
jgi:adenosylcobinamide-phosphate synthase